MLFMPFLAFAQSNIQGLVKGSDGLILQGVQVEIEDTYFKTYTNQEGAFMFGKLSAGSYQLNFSVEGYEPMLKTIQLGNKGQNVQVVLTHIRNSWKKLQFLLFEQIQKRQPLILS